MNIARILYPVEVLGPGKRIGLWLCGCNHGCKGCSNPELWEKNPKYEIPVEDTLTLIAKISDANNVDGFTITGGDPLDQSKDLAALVPHLHKISDDIIVYTGYTLNELTAKNSAVIDSILSSIAILIDGRYIEKRNNNSPLVGSDNQIIHVLNQNYREVYRQYLRTIHNQIQNFTTTDGVISVGIHRRDFDLELKKRINE